MALWVFPKNTVPNIIIVAVLVFVCVGISLVISLTDPLTLISYCTSYPNQSLLFVLELILLSLLLLWPWFKRRDDSPIPRFLESVNVFTLYCLLLFVVKPIFTYFLPETNDVYCRLILSDSRRLELTVKALSYVLIGVLAFYYGYFLIPRPTRLRFHSSSRIPKLSTVRLCFFGVASCFISLISLLILEITGRGFFVRINAPDARVDLLAGYGYVFWGVEFIIIFVLIWLVHTRGELDWSLIVVAALASLVLASFGGRMRVGILWLTLAFAHMIFRRRVKLISIIWISILIIFIVIFIMWRQSVIELRVIDYRTIIWDIPIQDVLGYYLLHIFVTFENFVALLDVTPTYLPYDFGRNLVQPIVQIIPRALWADKPVDVGNILCSVIYPDQTGGTPFTFIGNLYLSFGLIGIVTGMTALGFLLRILYEYVSRRIELEEVVLFYSIAMSELFMMLWGEYLGAVTNLVEISLPLIIGMKWARVIHEKKMVQV